MALPPATGDEDRAGRDASSEQLFPACSTATNQGAEDGVQGYILVRADQHQRPTASRPCHAAEYSAAANRHAAGCAAGTGPFLWTSNPQHRSCRTCIPPFLPRVV